MSDTTFADDENGWEQAGDGRQIKRDVDGQIIDTRLSSDAARQMQAGRSKNRNRQHQEDISELLAEAGYANPEDAPAHLKQLASMAASGRSGSVSALVAFIRHTRAGDVAETDIPELGSICPKCKQHVGELSGETLLKLLDMLESYQPGL
jgi:hypothetical protein